MPARKKTTKEPSVHEPSLLGKISDQAAHISHEIVAGTGHLLEVAADKFSAVKEKIINKIGDQTTANKEDASAVKKSAATSKAVKVAKAKVAAKKKVTAAKANQPIKKITNKKTVPKKAVKKTTRGK